MDRLPEYTFSPSYAHPYSPQPLDAVLDALVSALRATMAHPDQALQVSARTTLGEVRCIQAAARRRLTARQLALDARRPALLLEQIASALQREADQLRSRSHSQHLTESSLHFPPPPDPISTQFYEAIADIERRLTLARAVLDDARPTRLGEITERVARAFHLPVVALKSPSRISRVAFCRQLTMYLCRRTGASFPAIGQELNRDHATVMHGCAIVQRRAASEPAFRAFITRLEREVIGIAD